MYRPNFSAYSHQLCSRLRAGSKNPKYLTLGFTQDHHLFVMSSAVETSGLCAMLILPAVTEVAPVRVLLSNQPQFLLSPPTLELLLSCDRGRNVTKGLNVNQCVDVVAIAEAFDKPVLPNSSLDIVGQPDIHRARLVGHNVYIVGLASGYAVIINGIAFRNLIPPLRPTYGGPPVGMTEPLLSFLRPPSSVFRRPSVVARPSSVLPPPSSVTATA